MRYIINGRQLCGGHGGVQRYLCEVLREMDAMAPHGQVRVAVPSSAHGLPELRNIEYVRIGRLCGILWEQVSFALYLFLHRMKGVNLCTAVPLLYPFGINAIHDIMPRRHRMFRRHMKFHYYALLRLNYFLAIRYADRIVTVSNESREDICNFYNIPRGKVVLARNSWQHMERIRSEKPELDFTLEEGDFFLALSCNRIQKNFVWVEEAARTNPASQFVIVGGGDSQQRVSCALDIANLHYTGSLSDGNIKYLYEKCKAFLFPSIAEGFGIPPLEALSCGARVVCSNSSCLPEIYGNFVYYIDPYDYGVDLDALLRNSVWNPAELLARYSWQKTARVIYNLMVGGT